ncbi:MAG: hypothetical protein M5T52_08545 [Ignavibacteriaceae bacterium]|nr:hypothetical protein [Ignavibacteriaceae bacterium]
MKYVDILPLIIKTENNNINVPEADTINSHFKKELNSRNLFQIVNRSELNEDLKIDFFLKALFTWRNYLLQWFIWRNKCKISIKVC